MSDKEIVQKVLKGDLSAFSILVQQNERLVFHLMHKVLGNRHADTEDLAQEVFLKVFNNLKSFKHEAKLSTWIAKIAYRTAISHATRAGIKLADQEDLAIEPSDSISSPESELIDQEKRAFLHAQIEALPVTHKTCLLLFHFEEMSISEISDIMAISENNVKSYLFRARKKLKDLLLKHHPEKAFYHE